MIKIMVDSASDCGKEEGLYDLFVPLTVNIDGREYLDGVGLNADMFYDLLVSSKEFPKTSQPAPDVYLEGFEKIKEAGDELICFTLSSALSGTYQSACIAKSMVEYDGIRIIDTKTATHMIHVLARYAARRIREGASAEAIVEECEALKGKVKALAGLDTLEYLYRGGRLSRTSAAVGSIAGIKPIITVTEDGRVVNCGKAIGVGRAIQTMMDKLASYELDQRFPVYSLYSCGTENCEKLEEKLTKAGYRLGERLQVGPTIGAHVGPGAYAVIFVTK